LRFISECAVKAYSHLQVNEDEWSASRLGRCTPGEGSFLVPTGLRGLWERKLLYPADNEPRRRTDLTIRVLEAQAGAVGRGLETASVLGFTGRGAAGGP
jgi:hypothetical protein